MRNKHLYFGLRNRQGYGGRDIIKDTESGKIIEWTKNAEAEINTAHFARSQYAVTVTSGNENNGM